MTLVHKLVNGPVNATCVEVFNDVPFLPWHKTTTFFNGNHSAFGVQNLTMNQLRETAKRSTT
jgi:hypothetical protein